MDDWFSAARRRWRGAYARVRESDAPVTLVVVALMLGFVLGLLAGRWWIPDGTGAASGTDRARLAEGQDRRPAAHAERAVRRASTSVRLDRCEEVYTAQARPLRTVGPAMTQWEVHIGAMNKLVLGAITLAQAQEFWDQTREGAAQNLAEFDDARRGFERRTARCPGQAGQASEELRVCAATVDARHRALDRAAVALDTWRAHVRHMEMLRRGELSPEEATQAWLESWREGRRQVDHYRSAARAVQLAAGSHRQHHGGADGVCAG